MKAPKNVSTASNAKEMAKIGASCHMIQVMPLPDPANDKGSKEKKTASPTKLRVKSGHFLVGRWVA